MQVCYKVVTIVTGCHRIRNLRTLVVFNINVEDLTSSSRKMKFQMQVVMQVGIINHLVP